MHHTDANASSPHLQSARFLIATRPVKTVRLSADVLRPADSPTFPVPLKTD
ncbi:MAG: hypothetical protein AAGD96_13540 [Chloroflexota bacterium]